MTTWEVAYQSQGATAEPWLGPTLDEVFERAAAQGRRLLLVVPVGFVCDHVEILYDIDILFRGYAAARGISLSRPETLNDSPAFIATRAEVAQRCLT